MMLQRHRRLNHPLIKIMLQPIGHVPDVFPGFVGLEELVGVKELDALVVEFALEGGGHGEKVDRSQKTEDSRKFQESSQEVKNKQTRSYAVY